jgi:methylmalonyl-CoA/ethylmalonyl-CoA epimerase
LVHRKLCRFGNLSFFDCAGIRLTLEQRGDTAARKPSGCIYFRCADLECAACELERRGITFAAGPKLIAEMDDHDLRMAFFYDPDGHMLALMQETP